MKNVLMKIAYDGSRFNGWQKQPEQRTVQGEIEKALSYLCQKPMVIHGTSRTDAGVHAWGQCASFSGDFGIPVERIQVALNDLLGTGGKALVPGDIWIKEVKEVPQGFHARYDALAKTYVYKIRNREEMDVFSRNYMYHIAKPLSLEQMMKAAGRLKGTHDFKSFQASGGEEKESTVRTLHGISIHPMEEGWAIHVTGDGFLYNMVRILVGTLVEVGWGKRPPEEMTEILDAMDRQRAGHTAPAQGLYLAKVHFDVI